MILLKTTLTSDITRAFTLCSCRIAFTLSIRPQLLQNNIFPQHSPSTFTLSSCRIAFALSIRPELLQNNICPQHSP